MRDVGGEYLRAVRQRFAEMKQVAERAMAQVSDEELHWSPHEEANSIAVLVKHLSGNMRSRWTDIFTTDGEKPDRNRDAEFEPEALTRADLMEIWNQGWARFQETLDALTEEDLLRTVFIREQPHSVIQAIERQMYHYSYHIGQIVYIAKLLRGTGWQSLTIPRRRA
ncbi:putative damage-inducible protein DinB [Symbiobacterium terraclitae]|jgi:uncharacterized damage-inducible protein DinB|uniref:Damage-inducible protein DinB n=1 Tax=Symbiobacterium terraclitae TaxID=557451 RepID=A0ABS4JUH4_9FIRM|nr:DinB family protein [Symbiobacterium terraclitae]MBP2019197.1 putative damage-inducible protein DinB [Symbiobacterium terraclitae]